MASSYPSGTNTFVPDHAATGGLLIGFARNQNDFAVNKYIQIFEVKRRVGVYASYTSRHAARILSNDDAEHLWSCLLYTSPSPRDRTRSRMPSSA